MGIFQNNLLAAAAAAATTGDGSNLWGLGSNNNGQLGIGVSGGSVNSSPVQVLGGGTFISVSGGQKFQTAVKDDNTLWSWGYTYNGRLGNGSTTPNISTPVQIGSLTDWAKVTSFNKGSHGIKTDGTLWGWGANIHGEVGNGTTTAYSSPIQIGALTDWLKGGSQQHSSIFIKTDGTAWAWGSNGGGQLGIGDDDARSSPVQIGALTTWAQVAMGDGFCFGILTDGTLWSWGHTASGIGGRGTDQWADRISSPAQIGALTDWAQIAPGDGHALAVKTDGTLWAWGSNSSGRLGDGTTTNRSSPVQIGALTTWSKVSVMAYGSSAGIKTDGTLWTWGKGQYGATGHANQTNYSSPVQVGDLTNWVKGVLHTSNFMSFYVEEE
jgi:alpha-tubulin suppressor-like RCC1 family protein